MGKHRTQEAEHLEDERRLDKFLRSQPQPLRLSEIVELTGLPAGRVVEALIRMSMTGSAIEVGARWKSPWPTSGDGAQ